MTARSTRLVLVPGLACTEDLFADQITTLRGDLAISVADHAQHDTVSGIARTRIGGLKDIDRRRRVALASPAWLFEEARQGVRHGWNEQAAIQEQVPHFAACCKQPRCVSPVCQTLPATRPQLSDFLDLSTDNRLLQIVPGGVTCGVLSEAELPVLLSY